MFVFDGDGDACDDSEYSNSWGFAAMIWEALLERYGKLIVPEGRATFAMNDWPKLWKADEDDRLPLQPWERDVLRATYDHAIIRGADLERMADSFDRFEEAHAKPGSACSLKRIAARMRDLAAGVQTKFVRPDVCFQATSVAEDQWIVFDGGEDGRPYNIKRDTKHFYVDIAPGQAA